jgi:hypothetical protein
MLKMLEVVGTSPAGYDEAVRSAVEEIIRAGHAAHFFSFKLSSSAARSGTAASRNTKSSSRWPSRPVTKPPDP